MKLASRQPTPAPVAAKVLKILEANRGVVAVGRVHDLVCDPMQRMFEILSPFAVQT
jgi:hypothetical protein